MWYHVSEPNSYLAVTGAGVDSVRITKKAFIYPLQKVTKISITPFDFSMSLQAMTSEKLQFSLPAVFTIGPDDTVGSLMKYAVLLTGDSDGRVPTGAKGGMVATGRNHVQDIVKGIIEGETRSIVSNMTMEELFNNRRIFKAQVIECVQKELDQFGLRIYNANVKELQDLGESKYFQSLAQKAHEGAQSQAQVDVANARMIGKVGQAEKEGEAKQEIAKIDAKTAVLETERKVEKANADQKLKTREILISRDLKLEQIAAQRAAEQKDAELQKNVEQKRAEMELERLRATTVTQAKIAKESSQQKADADLYTQEKKADAAKYNQKAESEAVSAYILSTRQAEATYLARAREAEAAYITRKKESEGLIEMAKAYGALADVLGGPQGLMNYLMLKEGVYVKLAEANAKAVNGLAPKINVWTTEGGSGSGGADAMAPIQNLFKSLPPLFSTIQDQTGMTPPSWLANVPAQRNGEMEPEEKMRQKREGLGLTNGQANGH
ncbi:uncharacterized protein MYCGRDRAFT_73080 [Zymoseptoria tritici IPO323]|uniref:Band 7 domain-containing protein n=1 Tax=Zymoseptoria tritici (strain CBS 115943 / IPO323) TaxID=336722 RepID=F9XD97_ZYMTI|nr:uncharacterized protein MYCGRDRAFT_73080 [Zymoseptoria tritici IPO323]EGP86836.1 hypothetical protein MYCGRDRAFT_73080 [Zymoseptoria tritici IPO323]